MDKWLREHGWICVSWGGLWWSDPLDPTKSYTIGVATAIQQRRNGQVS